ncbi:MAG: hypothetical protein Q8L48_09450 [Archangium sp.]|nr:hypothetical protein [Archangium sp.]
MSVRTLRTLNELYTRDDGRLEPDEAQRLVDASRDERSVTEEERTQLRLVASSPRTTLGARNVIEAFLVAPAPATPLAVLPGTDASTFDDDRLVLGPDGSTRGASGVTPYTRSYAAVREGPMRVAHGSRPPSSTVLTGEEHESASTQPPAEALDAMARARGASLGAGFVAMANAKGAYDPTAPAWWGKCHAWAWSALSAELSARVDVGGPEGQRGLWLSGHWVSRADLGNFLMGVADTIALGEGNQLFRVPVTPTDLLQATAQFLLDGGGGVVADIHNDAVHGGDREVWNQPFVAADVDTQTLSGPGAEAVLGLARADGKSGTTVKHVHLVGRYGNERSNDWEGPAGMASRSWNVYAVTDASGAVVAAYLADDERLEGATGLPTRASHELPEYFWKPTLRSIDAGLEGSGLRAIDADPLAKEYRFFVGTVLTRGVPGSMRAAFEAEVNALPPGFIQAKDVAALLQAYSGVSEAYSPEQWDRAFASRGLSAKAFGFRDGGL